MAKVKGIVLMLLTLWALWVMVSTLDVCIHNGNPNYEYSRANFYEVLLAIDAQIKSPTETKVVLVVDCEYDKATGWYEVTVRDLDGNDWAYYDDEQQAVNDILTVTYREMEIIEVR